VREAMHTDVHCEWIDASDSIQSGTPNDDSGAYVVDMTVDAAEPPQQVRSTAQQGIGTQNQPMIVSSDSDSDSSDRELSYNSDGEAMYPVVVNGGHSILGTHAQALAWFRKRNAVQID
jgi:hypothetical protein